MNRIANKKRHGGGATKATMIALLFGLAVSTLQVTASASTASTASINPEHKAIQMGKDQSNSLRVFVSNEARKGARIDEFKTVEVGT